jgi:hypothetical protein
MAALNRNAVEAQWSGGADGSRRRCRAQVQAWRGAGRNGQPPDLRAAGMNPHMKGLSDRRAIAQAIQVLGVSVAAVVHGLSSRPPVRSFPARRQPGPTRPERIVRSRSAACPAGTPQDAFPTERQRAIAAPRSRGRATLVSGEAAAIRQKALAGFYVLVLRNGLPVLLYKSP